MKPSPGSVPAIRLEGLTKRFGAATDAAAVEGIDLEVGDGEFFSLLGPSGSGKSTVGRMLAARLGRDLDLGVHGIVAEQSQLAVAQYRSNSGSIMAVRKS